MQVQIVRASTRHRALAEARRTMGPDPLVLSVRRRPGSRGNEEWEAIVARETPEPLLAPVAEESASADEAQAPTWSELESFRTELASFRTELSRRKVSSNELFALAHRLSMLEGELTASALRGEEISPRWAPLVRRLEVAGYPRVEALRIAHAAQRPGTDGEGVSQREVDALVRSALQDGLEVAPAEERLGPGLVVFAGGAGVGKTTMAAKLAADLCLGGAASPILGSILPRRGVGLETIRRCAQALGIDFVEVREKEQVAELARRSLEAPVILDSPSLSPLDEDRRRELKEILSEAPQAEVHAVVSARYAESELTRAVDAVAWAPRRRLAATHLDEAPYLGRVMATATRTRIPISYLSLGPRIPDDLARPGVQALVDSVLHTSGALAS